MQQKQQEQQPHEGGLRQKLNIALNLCIWLSFPLSLALSRPGTVGYRYVRGKSAAVGLLLLYLWALAAKSEALLYGGTLVALATMAEHRLKSRLGGDVHSYAMGASRFNRIGEKPGRIVEAFLAVFGGCALMTIDEGAGSYLGCAGIAHAFTLCYVYGRAEAVDQDVLDAQLEAAHRAGRHSDRPLF